VIARADPVESCKHFASEGLDHAANRSICGAPWHSGILGRQAATLDEVRR